MGVAHSGEGRGVSREMMAWGTGHEQQRLSRATLIVASAFHSHCPPAGSQFTNVVGTAPCLSGVKVFLVAPTGLVDSPMQQGQPSSSRDSPPASLQGGRSPFPVRGSGPPTHLSLWGSR